MTSSLEPTPVTSAPSVIATPDLVRLAQGFYFIFWGLLVAVLVGAQIMLVFWVHSFAEIFLAAGVLAVLVGTWRLAQVPLADGLASPAVAAWRGRARWLLALAGLLTYFCLFFYMWRRRPLNLYLQVNASAFVGVGLLYVLVLSRTVTVLATLLGRRELAVESRLFGIGNLLLLVVPFLGALLWTVQRAAAHHSNPLLEFHFLLTQVNLLVSVILLLPFSLTLSLVWSAKDAALRQLSGRGGES